MVQTKQLHSRLIVLSKPIAGFEATSLGPKGAISEIAAGTRLKLCGSGFSEQAARVLANGRYYFVFVRDIETTD
jgi:hypothetical protein